MKNHRFLWLRNRTTDNRKCEKARNIKEKRTIEMFNTVSKQQDVLLSSPRDNYLSGNLIPKILWVFGIFFMQKIPFTGIYMYFFYIQFAEILKNQYFFYLFSDILKKR